MLRNRHVFISTSLVRIVTFGAEGYMILLAVIRLKDICCWYFQMTEYL